MALVEKFNTLEQKVTDAQSEMLAALKDELKNKGVQNFIYDNGTGIVPVSFINEIGEVEVINLDHIRFNDKKYNDKKYIETIEVHDSDNDVWEQLFLLPYDTIAIIISYIDWK